MRTSCIFVRALALTLLLASLAGTRASGQAAAPGWSTSSATALSKKSIPALRQAGKNAGAVRVAEIHVVGYPESPATLEGR